ncbi:ribonuclease [Pontixanthobacter sp.]|uniref:ribonuclease n=1 Tax=Pontixanthobacter sp. TaxID=2792078 RepID=UPI003C7AB83B
MAEWQIERGIGEDRAILTEGGHILQTRQHWHGELISGSIITAILVSKIAGSKRGTGRLSNGTEILIDRLPANAQEGAEITVEVTRSAIGERGRLKMAQARPSTSEPASITVEDSLATTRFPVRPVRRFTVSGWSGIIADSLAQSVTFNGGTLLLSPTPAMLMIDIDGILPPRGLAMAAIPAIARAIRQFDIGGMIGIDFPTVSGRQDRRAVDEALDAALGDWQHERTAMNGFGFVQLVARLQRPSLFHRASTSRAGLIARQLLRQAEHLSDPGAILLSVHPAIKAKLNPNWLEQLARRTGREVRIEVQPALALEGAFAQSVPL